jgi:hypothetical protein
VNRLNLSMCRQAPYYWFSNSLRLKATLKAVLGPVRSSHVNCRETQGLKPPPHDSILSANNGELRKAAPIDMQKYDEVRPDAARASR